MGKWAGWPGSTEPVVNYKPSDETYFAFSTTPVNALRSEYHEEKHAVMYSPARSMRRSIALKLDWEEAVEAFTDWVDLIRAVRDEGKFGTKLTNRKSCSLP
jgi:hypothetical protein